MRPPEHTARPGTQEKITAAPASATTRTGDAADVVARAGVARATTSAVFPPPHHAAVYSKLAMV